MKFYELFIKNRYYIYLLLAAPLWYVLFGKYIYNSDYALGFVATSDFSNGNILLKNWIIGNDSFYTTDLLWQCLLAGLINNLHVSARLFSTISIALLYFIIWRYVLSMQDRNNGKGSDSFNPLLPELCFALATVIFIGMASHIYGTPSRAMTIFFSLAAAYILFKRQQNVWHWLLFLFCAVCALAGDKYSYVFLLAPAACVLLGNMYAMRKFDRKILLLLCAFLLALLLRKFLGDYGFYTPGVKLRFAELLQLPNHLLYCLGGLFRCINAMFWGKSFNDPNILINLFFFCIMCLIVYANMAVIRRTGLYGMSRFAGSCQETYARFLILSSICVCCAYIFSSLPIAEEFPQFRYFTGCYINSLPVVLLFCLALISQFFPDIKKLRVALVLTGFIFLAGLTAWKAPEQEISALEQIGAMLAAKGHMRGYGEFWSANAGTFYGNGKPLIKPMIFANEQYKPYEWMSHAWQPELPHTFIIKNDANKFPGFETDRIYKKFGEPAEYLKYGGYEIFCYDQPIDLERTADKLDAPEADR